jgi:hypothetical protein
MAGRPKAKIDWERVDQLARAHCSMTGIAKIMKYSTPTISLAIERTFNMRATDYLHERKEEGTALMREAIYEAGLKGNIIAQIFWLKNRDGWSDRQQVTHEILPTIQVALPGDTTEQDSKMIQEFFKTGDNEDNQRIYTKPASLQGRSEVDN